MPPRSVTPRTRVPKCVQRLTRALKTLSATSHALLHAPDEEYLLREVCRVIVEEGGYRLAWVIRLDHNEARTPRLAAHAGIEEGFLESVNSILADTDLSHSATSAAIRTGKPAVLRNIRSNTNDTLWREQNHEYASLIALPVFVENDIFGAVTIVAPEPKAFDEEEVRLLNAAVMDLAHGISALRLREKTREAQEAVRRMAFHDTLTNLPNRILLCERIEKAIVQGKQKNLSFSLLRLQIDRFREINETLGYQEADKLLQEVAARLAKTITEPDCVARVGEAEFAVLLRKGGADQAIRIANKIIVALGDPVELSGLLVDTHASVGIALFPGHGTNADILLRRASVALHQARHDGNDYATYSGGLEEEHTRSLALVGDLRRAINNNELLLYCQPKVHIPTRRVSGAEALLRWSHPQLGLLGPGEFIKLAENAGLITPITYWVLDAALRQSYAWHEGGEHWPLSVNLCVRDLRDPKLMGRIRGSFATWGAQPDWIQFELTETSIMEDPAVAIRKLSQIKELGVRLMIDDFGIGHSSLSYLQKLPVDTIKIDQSFVGRMTIDKGSATIVRSAIDLGHDLNLEVIAEGVESDELLAQVTDLGCDAAQGYAVGKPLPAEQFHDWEAQSRWH